MEKAEADRRRTRLSVCSFGTTLLVFRESSFQIVGISHVIAQRKCHEHDVFRKDDSDISFGGSSSVFETNSTLSVGHVCLQRNESTGVYLYTYSPYKEPPILANGTPPFAGEIGKKSNEWTNDSHYYYVPNTTVLIVRIYGENIAHCMSDIIFSIAPAIPQLWNATSTPKTFLHVEKSDNQRLWDSCNSWCCHAYRHAGIIAADAKAVFHNDIQWGGVPVCFERLIVPRIGIYRRPTPISAVQAARAHLMKSTGLDPSPWQINPRDDVVPILFYDRRGAGRRIWNNSQAVAHIMEQNYKTSIRVVGQDWNGLNFTQQTSLFHEYPIIITPHGAHLANLMFGRPNTQVVELVCSNEAVCPPKNWTPSLLTFAWFPSFSRQIPMDHYQLPINDCNDKGGYSPKTFAVNISTFIPCVVQWLGLKERNAGNGTTPETGALIPL
eukprot:CAMPEP_0202488838 /NCGR_PEP_ID=MMETSP1361-20130828/6775_1 /ASSEMBLY_ACC=CAM_ASM_000849 /TAXON_ID=210615 /ORGANISM="Staurosira complex sp., Strain CCMP2646" /LENGTH=438 /DNA_ID=CAMNT_0049118503 /DNA_START=60 /DNA_END=1379 /DNA_ORIENTATION=-